MIDLKIVEGLARELYEASNSTNVPWARRNQMVRGWWRDSARAQLLREAGPTPSEAV